MTIETIEVGSVVALKSGGQAMTVVSVESDGVECIWCGEEGDLFRETIPTVALQIATMIDSDDDEEEEQEDDETEEEEEEDEDEAVVKEPASEKASDRDAA